MSARNFILATAGHVDHGKSALVKALTGTDPDRLPDEKARGITIDLGFAEMTLRNGTFETFHVGIVDVPGHEDFVKNMIAGVGSIDLALLVVAADDGWMPQTEEHLQILTYLGIENAVIALTKADLTGAAKTAGDIREQLRGTPFESAPIVETSIVSGHGLEELKQILVCELSSLPPPPEIGKPRLFVDRVFSLRGIGTVVTGTLTGGRLASGQDVVVQPQTLSTRVRTIQSHNRAQEEIGPGTRTALNLPNLETSDIARGDVVTVPELGEPDRIINVLLIRSPRSPAQTQVIKNSSSVYFHHGTRRVSARVALADRKDLGPGDTALAQLRLQSPIFAFVGDRFVLRDPSERHTMAGGVVLEVQANREQFREVKQGGFLEARANSPSDPVVAARSELRRDGAKEQAALLVRSNFSSTEIAMALEQLVVAKEIVRQGDIFADTVFWAQLRQRAIELVENEHVKNPQQAGLDLTQLRATLHHISPRILDTLILDLAAHGYDQVDNHIKRSDHRSVLSPNLATIAEKIRRQLSEKPFDPPSRKQIAVDPESRQALSFLIKQGEIVEVNSDLLLSREAFLVMKTNLLELFRRKQSATVSEIRQALQTSRRVMVPFLEMMDTQKVTRRVGDKRLLA